MGKKEEEQITEIIQLLNSLANKVSEIEKSNTNPIYQSLRQLILDNNTKVAEAIAEITQNIGNIFIRIEAIEQKPEPVIQQTDLEPIKQEIEKITQLLNKLNEAYGRLTSMISSIMSAEEHQKEKIENVETRLHAFINILTKEYGEKLGSGIKGEEYKLKQQIHKQLKDMKKEKDGWITL